MRATARRAEQEARAQKIEAAMARMRAARAAQPEPATQDPVPQPVDDYRAVLLIANNRDETVVHVAFSECLVVGAQNLVGSPWGEAGSEDAVVMTTHATIEQLLAKCEQDRGKPVRLCPVCIPGGAIEFFHLDELLKMAEEADAMDDGVS